MLHKLYFDAVVCAAHLAHTTKLYLRPTCAILMFIKDLLFKPDNIPTIFITCKAPTQRSNSIAFRQLVATLTHSAPVQAIAVCYLRLLWHLWRNNLRFFPLLVSHNLPWCQ